MNKTVYIAGKVTGEDPEKTIAKFAQVQKEWEEKGYKVLNPIEIVNDMNADWVTAMKLCINALMTADGLKEEAREVMKSNEVSAELKNLDNNIDDYFMDIAKRKAENLRNDMFSRHREREDLNNILRNEDYVYVKGPLLKTQWRQRNNP